MRYIALLISILLCVALPDEVRAEDSRYRVEILVLNHLNSSEQPLETDALEDFSQALDFLTPPVEYPDEPDGAVEPSEGAEGLPDALPGAAGDMADPTEPPPEEPAADPWNVVSHVEEMGPEMQDAWRRLRLSAAFRPLQFLAWEQGGAEPFPLLRIHDLEAVRVEDPWAEHRLGAQLAAAMADDSGSILPDSESSADPLATTADVESGSPVETLPDPIIFFRLDGTASLTRSRFLHLSLAIEWREQAPEVQPLLPAEPDAAPPLPAFLIHRLDQSRPVRTGRMEYFDGPVLGVLAWITDISDTVITSQPE